MDILITFIVAEILFAINLLIFYIVFNKRLTAWEQTTSSIVKRVDAIFTADLSSPNEATVVEKQVNVLNEDNMLNISPNVKLEVEGGDTIPPGYEVRSGT